MSLPTRQDGVENRDKVYLKIIGWKKFRGQLNLDEAVGRVQFGCQRNFLTSIISKLDKHVVLFHINYIAG